jgi:hypothetical protein
MRVLLALLSACGTCPPLDATPVRGEGAVVGLAAETLATFQSWRAGASTCVDAVKLVPEIAGDPWALAAWRPATRQVAVADLGGDAAAWAELVRPAMLGELCLAAVDQDHLGAELGATLPDLPLDERFEDASEGQQRRAALAQLCAVGPGETLTRYQAAQSCGDEELADTLAGLLEGVWGTPALSAIAAGDARRFAPVGRGFILASIVDAYVASLSFDDATSLFVDLRTGQPVPPQVRVDFTSMDTPYAFGERSGDLYEQGVHLHPEFGAVRQQGVKRVWGGTVWTLTLAGVDGERAIVGPCGTSNLTVEASVAGLWVFARRDGVAFWWHLPARAP